VALRRLSSSLTHRRSRHAWLRGILVLIVDMLARWHQIEASQPIEIMHQNVYTTNPKAAFRPQVSDRTKIGHEKTCPNIPYHYQITVISSGTLHFCHISKTHAKPLDKRAEICNNYLLVHFIPRIVSRPEPDAID
jgi:hypothetical protein